MHEGFLQQPLLSNAHDLVWIGTWHDNHGISKQMKRDHQYWHKSLRYVSYFVLASSQPCWIAHAELPRCTVALSIFLRLFSHICTHSARPLIITGTRYYLLLLPPRVTTIRELQFKLNPSKKPPSLDDTINSVPTATEAFCKARKLLSYYWRESCRFLVVSLLKRSNRSLARDTIQMSWV